MNAISSEEFQDRETLRDLLSNKWCRGVDRLNWKLMRSLYADEVAIFYQDPALPGVPEPRVWNTDEWLHFCRAIEGFDVTTHHLSNYLFDIDGDRASVQTYLWSQHILDKESYVVGGEYTHKLQRAGDTWKLDHVQLDIRWTTGDASLFARAMELSQSGKAPRSQTAILF